MKTTTAKMLGEKLPKVFHRGLTVVECNVRRDFREEILNTELDLTEAFEKWAKDNGWVKKSLMPDIRICPYAPENEIFTECPLKTDIATLGYTKLSEVDYAALGTDLMSLPFINYTNRQKVLDIIKGRLK